MWPAQAAELGATVPSVGAGSAFVYELVLPAILMFVIMAVATDARAVGAAAAIAIGGTVGLRSLGQALASGEWAHFWIYVLGRFFGAVFAPLAYRLVRGDRPQLIGAAERP